MGGFVRIDGRLRMDARHDRRHDWPSVFEHLSDRVAVALAGYDDNLPLAGLVLGKATVNAIGDPVRRPDVPAEIGPINGDGAVDCRALGLLGFERFAKLVREDERALVGHAQVAPELQRSMAVGAVGEDRYGKQIIPDRALAVGKDAAASYRKLMLASLALVNLAGGVGVALRPPQSGQTGLPPVSAQRIRRKASWASSSLVRATDASESVRAAELIRKGCVIPMPTNVVDLRYMRRLRCSQPKKVGLTEKTQIANSHQMTPEQSRAARGWLDWTQAELAKAANVGVSTVKDFEARKRTPIGNNLTALRNALQAHGIVFTDNGIAGPPHGEPG
jgi:DNA-binding transcriptional regulator YiaG